MKERLAAEIIDATNNMGGAYKMLITDGKFSILGSFNTKNRCAEF